MSLEALGLPLSEVGVEQVNKVLGAQPLQGASWDQVAGAASHFGCRATLVVPSTLAQVRAWTDAGTPVLIGWNTGSEWSHASLIFDVTDTHVYIADPNITNPERTTHVLPHDEFYEKWYEKAAPGYKIRRSAMAIEREITPDGRQVMASSIHSKLASKVATRFVAGKKLPEVWAVMMPKNTSELEDIWFNAGEFIQSQFQDHGGVVHLFDNRMQARDVAKLLLKTLPRV
jgi:hypothetical protein